MRKPVTVRQQTELNSKQWGVYIGALLVEGGFFSRNAAENAADEYRAIRAGADYTPSENERGQS